MAKTSSTAVRLAALGMLACAIAGCGPSQETSSAVLNKGREPIMVQREVSVAPGESSTATVVYGQPVRIDGAGAGVTAIISERNITVTADKNAKEGKVELTVYDEAGQSAPLTVVVKKATASISASITLIQFLNATVERGQEVVVKFTNGKAASISEAKDGLSARIDGDMIKLTASKDAKLGEQTVTIMSSEGETRLTVKVESK